MNVDLDTAAFAGSPPTTDPTLLLQKMENRLVRLGLSNPDVLSDTAMRRLRYILNFARLTDFEPGAAGPNGARGRGDITVGPQLAPWRSRVTDALHGPLHEERDAVTALQTARAALEGLAADQDDQRQVLAERHRNDFSAAELDSEVGYKKLVTILGGGGGAGFVYIGGLQRLSEADHIPDYLIGSSFGAIIGAVAGRTLPVPVEEYVEWAKTVSYRGILGSERLRRRHGLKGVFSLRFDAFARAMFTRADGERMRMSDMAIPFDAVVSGVRKGSFATLPARFRRPELAGLHLLPTLPVGIRPLAAARMWQAAAFIDSRMVKPIVLGGDELTRELNVVDATSFSSSIPGVLHHETSDPSMEPLLDALCRDHDVAALVDGGAASNVAIELAWKRVRDGRLGTRNACYMAFDCFHPQWDPKHLWLVPITQAVQLQMLRNAPYADCVVRFAPTLSPANLAPSVAAIDRACEWGSTSVDKQLPVISALLQPIWWQGDKPPVTRARKPRTISVANPMSAVMSAIQLQTGRLRRRRNGRQA